MVGTMSPRSFIENSFDNDGNEMAKRDWIEENELTARVFEGGTIARRREHNFQSFIGGMYPLFISFH